MKKKHKPFYTIIYDINKRDFEPYDVMPYLIDEYKNKKKKKRHPNTFDEFKKFIEGASMYMYWSRCEYEIILLDWPPSGKGKKIDIHHQIMMNIDVVTNLLMENVL